MRREVATTDIVVIGSMSVVAELAEQELVQEYRLLLFPTVLGAGIGLFRGHHELTLVSTEHVGPGVLAVLTPQRPGVSAEPSEQVSP
ncbi:dihydrofolate reductase family protein [Jatrophihabitans sp.]|uniref:dihydrofolate reductase family protein n=1 Tax=Jatrophihabitans sp. TaxID=1932789 RepID=UPI002F01425C